MNARIEGDRDENERLLAAENEELRDVMNRVGQILGIEPTETHLDAAKRWVESASRVAQENFKLKGGLAVLRKAATEVGRVYWDDPLESDGHGDRRLEAHEKLRVALVSFEEQSKEIQALEERNKNQAARIEFMQREESDNLKKALDEKEALEESVRDLETKLKLVDSTLRGRKAEIQALEERCAFAEQARDNAIAQRDVVMERSKAKAQTAGRIISQLKALALHVAAGRLSSVATDHVKYVGERIDEILKDSSWMANMPTPPPQPTPPQPTPPKPTHPCSQCGAPYYDDGEPAFEDHPGAR